MNKTVKNSLLLAVFAGMLLAQPAARGISFEQIKSIVAPYVTLENGVKAALVAGFACIVGYIGYSLLKPNKKPESPQYDPYYALLNNDPVDNAPWPDHVQPLNQDELSIPNHDKMALLALLDDIEEENVLDNYKLYLEKLKAFRDKPYCQSGSQLLTLLNPLIKSLMAYKEPGDTAKVWFHNALKELKKYLENN